MLELSPNEDTILTSDLDAQKIEASKQRRQVIVFAANPPEKIADTICKLSQQKRAIANSILKEEQEMKQSFHASSNDSTFGDPKE